MIVTINLRQYVGLDPQFSSKTKEKKKMEEKYI